MPRSFLMKAAFIFLISLGFAELISLIVCAQNPSSTYQPPQTLTPIQNFPQQQSYQSTQSPYSSSTQYSSTPAISMQSAPIAMNPQNTNPQPQNINPQFQSPGNRDNYPDIGVRIANIQTQPFQNYGFTNTPVITNSTNHVDDLAGNPLLPLQTDSLQQIERQFERQKESMEFSHGYCRVSVAWGGGEPRVWEGTLRLTDGTMRQMVSLGAEPDVPGSLWLDENGTLNIASRSPKSYSGMHITLDCTPTAQLQIQMTDHDHKSQLITTVMIADLIRGAVQQTLDQSGNHIRLERVPGDELSIHIPKGTTILSPNEMTEWEILPRFLNHPHEKNLSLTVAAYRGRTNDRVNEAEFAIPDEENPPNSAKSAAIPVPFRAPNEEGVYDIVLTLHQKSNDRFPLFGSRDKTLVQRTFQCFILSPTLPNRANPTAAQWNDRGTLVESVDPSNPNWWRRFSKLTLPLPRIGYFPGTNNAESTPVNQYEPFPQPQEEKTTLENVRDRVSQLSPGQLLNRSQPKTFWQENFGSGHVVPYHSSENNVTGFAEMPPPLDKNSPPWEAYPIPITEPNKPHFLEIDYLSGVPQTLGISIVEPSPVGGFIPSTVDSGLRVEKEIVSDQPVGRVLQHRILFYPKTKTPIILLVNRRDDQSAVYGALRIYRAPDEFSAFLGASGNNVLQTRNQQRLFAAYLHRPNFCESFSATRAPGNLQNIGVTDWETFYQGISRFVQYLRMSGYGGAMVSVASDGSSLYPSPHLSPTPRYDSGVFLPHGEDPVRKDVLAALAVTFDRENLTLIPAVDFCMPLPSLEERIRQDAQAVRPTPLAVSGLRYVGPYGNILPEQAANPDPSGRGAYYNLLNPDVQNAMIDVIRELVERSAGHPSFGGVAVQLSPDGYAILPDEYYGMDDNTIAKFSRDTRINVPGEGEQRLLTRAEFIRSQCLEQWIRWRAEQTTKFYRRMADVITNARPDAKLYLAGAKMFDHPVCQRFFTPSLLQSVSVYQPLMYLGMDPESYQNTPNIIFMRPEKLTAENHLANIAVNLELQHADMAHIFRQTQSWNYSTASLFYHQPLELTLPAFDSKSPFKPSRNWFAQEILPANDQNRKRFIRHLADNDVFFLFDGGVTQLLGEEDSVREMMMQYQMLPQTPFQTFRSGDEQTTQPITMRYANTERGTYCYLINNAPFSVPVRVAFSSRQGSRIHSFTALRQLSMPKNIEGGFEWSETLKPYDFVAFFISDVNAKPERIDVNSPANLIGMNGQLGKKLNQLDDRIRLSRSWLAWDVLVNGSFETSPEEWKQYVLSQQQLHRNEPAAQKTPGYSRYLTPPRWSELFSPRNHSAASSASTSVISSEETGNRNSSNAIDFSNATSNAALLENAGNVPGWILEGDATVSAMVDSSHAKAGTKSIQITAKRASETLTPDTLTSGTLLSHPFPSPQTGRLFVSLWVGVSQDATQLPLRLVLKGEYQNRPFLRSATIGTAIWDKISQSQAVDGVKWRPVVVPFSDLPLTNLETLSVGVELSAPATVWIDDVKLFHLAFTDTERTSLMRTLSVANYYLNKGRISDTLGILDGYWSQLLAECMPNVEELVAAQSQLPPAATPASPSAKQAAQAVPPPQPEKNKTWSDRLKKFRIW
ncbi:MAG: hypothetical protein LBJ67_17500 [Planctomycetaceae bacterium]|nr:hypothetical protein [Planctomycetaceae bacterium]